MESEGLRYLQIIIRLVYPDGKKGYYNEKFSDYFHNAANSRMLFITGCYQ